MRTLQSLTQAALLSVSFASIGACGGGSAGAPSPTTMPEGGTFTGVFDSPQYGRLQMRQNGTTVIGEYVKDEREGRIEGNANGNVLRFTWVEHREMIRGRPTSTRGRGYFQYVIDENQNHALAGFWGHDDSETNGGPWRAIKSRRAQPQLSTDSPSNDPDTQETNPNSDGNGQGSSLDNL